MKGGYLYLLVFLGLFLAACTSASEGDDSFTLADIFGTESTFYKIFSLQFLGLEDGTVIGAFMRAMVGLLIFAILFEVGTRTLFAAPAQRKFAGIIAGVLAIMTAIFLPDEILAGIGSSYAIAFAAILIGLPVVGGLWVTFGSGGEPRKPIISHTRFGHGLRIIILVILLWILMAVKNHALTLVGM